MRKQGFGGYKLLQSYTPLKWCGLDFSLVLDSKGHALNHCDPCASYLEWLWTRPSDGHSTVSHFNLPCMLPDKGPVSNVAVYDSISLPIPDVPPPYCLPKCAKTHELSQHWELREVMHIICQCLGNLPLREMWRGLIWQTFHFNQWNYLKASHNAREWIWHSSTQFLSPGHANFPSLSHHVRCHGSSLGGRKIKEESVLISSGTRYKISQTENQRLEAVLSRARFPETALPCSSPLPLALVVQQK